jgi:predicted nuclease with TOPRIM domain
LLVDQLQRQKDLYNEQLSKNTELYDLINNLEKELAAINANISKLQADLAYLEEKYNRATGLNGELVAIIEELKIAIFELTNHSRMVKFILFY